MPSQHQALMREGKKTKVAGAVKQYRLSRKTTVAGQAKAPAVIKRTRKPVGAKPVLRGRGDQVKMTECQTVVRKLMAREEPVDIKLMAREERGSKFCQLVAHSRSLPKGKLVLLYLSVKK